MSTYILSAALLALALTTPAVSAPRHHPRTVCVPSYEPGVGPVQVCARRVR